MRKLASVLLFLMSAAAASRVAAAAAAAARPVIIRSMAAEPTATVFFMHGLGDTGHGWSPIAEQIAAPHIKYVLPHAHSRPVTINGGMEMPAWCGFAWPPCFDCDF